MSINQNGRGARECMTFEQRPSTPPEISKYRKSNNLEPGKRFQHPGLKDDYKTMGLDDKIYGATDKHSIGRTTAAQLINLPKASELERMNGVKAEKMYKSVNREPLGHGPERGVVLPMKFTVGAFLRTFQSVYAHIYATTYVPSCASTFFTRLAHTNC